MTTLAESFLADLDDLDDASDREQDEQQEEDDADEVSPALCVNVRALSDIVFVTDGGGRH